MWDQYLGSIEKADLVLMFHCLGVVERSVSEWVVLCDSGSRPSYGCCDIQRNQGHHHEQVRSRGKQRTKPKSKISLGFPVSPRSHWLFALPKSYVRIIGGGLSSPVLLAILNR